MAGPAGYGQLAEAANAAAIARQGYPLNPNQYPMGFDDMNASEWLGYASA